MSAAAVPPRSEGATDIETVFWNKCLENSHFQGYDSTKKKQGFDGVTSLFIKKIKETARKGPVGCLLHSYGSSISLNSSEGAYCQQEKIRLCQKIQLRFDDLVGKGIKIELFFWKGNKTLDGALTFKASWSKESPFQEIYQNAFKLIPEYTSVVELHMWRSLAGCDERLQDDLYDSGLFGLNRSDEVSKVKEYFNEVVSKIIRQIEVLKIQNLQKGYLPIPHDVFSSKHSRGRFLNRNFTKIANLLKSRLPEHLSSSYKLSLDQERVEEGPSNRYTNYKIIIESVLNLSKSAS